MEIAEKQHHLVSLLEMCQLDDIARCRLQRSEWHWWSVWWALLVYQTTTPPIAISHMHLLGVLVPLDIHRLSPRPENIVFDFSIEAHASMSLKCHCFSATVNGHRFQTILHLACPRTPSVWEHARSLLIFIQTRLLFGRRHTARERATETRFVAAVTLTLTKWPWHTNFRRRTCVPKMKI